MAIDYATFVANPRYTHWATEDTVRQGLIAAYLEDAECEINPDYFTCQTEKAVFLLAAHMLQLLDASGQTTGLGGAGFGQISSLSVSHGSQSASFKTLDGGATETETEWLKRTPYGLAYLRLKSKRPVVGFVI